MQLRTAKPLTLDQAINLASELEFIRSLEHAHLSPDGKVRGVSDIQPTNNSQMEALLGVVEGLRQEVKSLHTAVQTLQTAPNDSQQSVAAAAPAKPQAQRACRGV